jgi:radical SAM modification target selenobiotic family peptide
MSFSCYGQRVITERRVFFLFPSWGGMILIASICGKEVCMNREDLKRILAGFSIVGLLSAAGLAGSAQAGTTG